MDPILIFIGSDMSFFIVFVQLITYNAKNYNLLGQSKKDLLIIKTWQYSTLLEREKDVDIHI